LAGLIKVKDSYNIDAIAIAVGTAAIADQDHKNANAQKIKDSRTEMALDLEELGFTLYPSESNFLLASLSPIFAEKFSADSAEFLYEILKQRGILVRYFKQPRLTDKLRITVGTPEQNAALIKTLRDCLN